MGKNNLGKLKKQILPTLKSHDVVRAAIFGSYARGEENLKSDLDILVKFKGSKSLLDLVGLELDLKDKLKIDIDFKVAGTGVSDNIIENCLIFNNSAYGVDIGSGVQRTTLRSGNTFNKNASGSTHDERY